MTLREKRLELCLGHMQGVPVTRIDLSDFGLEKLIGVGHDQGCGAAGCVVGHIQTIPEYREWEQHRYGHHSLSISGTIKRVLTWVEYATPFDNREPWFSPDCGKEQTLFAAGCRGELGKQEAIRRLEYLIAQEQATP